MGYVLKKDGQMVTTFVSERPKPNGEVSRLTRRVVGRAGMEFDDLYEPGLKERVHAGELDDVWEVSGPVPVDEPDDDPPGDDAHGHDVAFDKMSPEEMEHLLEQHAVQVVGTGAGGNVLKRDMVGALVEAHADGHVHAQDDTEE